MATTPNADALAKSRTFLTAPRAEAVAKYPDLAKAFEIRDELQKIAADAKPINPTVKIQIENTIQKSVAAALTRGNEPTITERTPDQVRFQVAYASAEHVAGVRRINPESTLNITKEHRDILIQHAERSIRVPANEQRPELTAEIHTRARETAGLVGLLDLPKTDNPFKGEALKAAYTQQQNEQRDRQALAQRSQQRGFDRS